MSTIKKRTAKLNSNLELKWKVEIWNKKIQSFLDLVNLINKTIKRLLRHINTINVFNTSYKKKNLSLTSIFIFTKALNSLDTVYILQETLAYFKHIDSCS